MLASYYALKPFKSSWWVVVGGWVGGWWLVAGWVVEGKFCVLLWTELNKSCLMTLWVIQVKIQPQEMKTRPKMISCIPPRSQSLINTFSHGPLRDTISIMIIFIISPLIFLFAKLSQAQATAGLSSIILSLPMISCSYSHPEKYNFQALTKLPSSFISLG